MSIVGPAPGMMDTSGRSRRTITDTLSRVLGEIEKPDGGTTLVNYPDLSQRHRQEAAAIIATANEQPIKIKIKRSGKAVEAPAAAVPRLAFSEEAVPERAAASVEPEVSSVPVTIRRRKPKVPEAESAAAAAGGGGGGAVSIYAEMKGNPKLEPFTRTEDYAKEYTNTRGKVRARTLDEIAVVRGSFISPPIFISPLKYKIDPTVLTVLNELAEIAGLKTPLKEETFKARAERLSESNVGVSPDKGLFFEAEERLPYGRENRLTEGKTNEELNEMLPENRRIAGGSRPSLMQRVTAEHNKKFAVPVEQRFMDMVTNLYETGDKPSVPAESTESRDDKIAKRVVALKLMKEFDKRDFTDILYRAHLYKQFPQFHNLSYEQSQDVMTGMNEIYYKVADTVLDYLEKNPAQVKNFKLNAIEKSWDDLIMRGIQGPHGDSVYKSVTGLTGSGGLRG